MTAGTTLDMHARLWNRSFVLWWLGTAQSSLGTSLSGIALSFLVLQRTGSSSALGVTLALTLLPGLFSPLAGTWIDRMPLRPPLILSDTVRGLLMLSVGLAASQGQVSLFVIDGLALVMGLIGALYTPAAGALLPAIVPQSELARANALIGAATQASSLIGVLSGGVLVSRVGSASSLILDAVTFLMMAVLLFFVTIRKKVSRQDEQSLWFDFVAGFRYMCTSPVLILVPVTALFVNASIAPILMLLPKRMLELGAGAAGYGLFQALLTGGIVVGSMFMAALGNRVRPFLGNGLGLILIALSFFGMSRAVSAWGLWVLATAIGLGLALTNTCTPVLLQTLVESKYLGRVFSFQSMFGQIGMPLTLLALSPVADKLTISTIFIIAGSVTLSAGVIWGFCARDEIVQLRLKGI